MSRLVVGTLSLAVQANASCVLEEGRQGEAGSHQYVIGVSWAGVEQHSDCSKIALSNLDRVSSSELEWSVV